MRALLAVVTKVELFINLKAAKILGLEFSPSLIGGADGSTFLKALAVRSANENDVYGNLKYGILKVGSPMIKPKRGPHA